MRRWHRSADGWGLPARTSALGWLIGGPAAVGGRERRIIMFPATETNDCG